MFRNSIERYGVRRCADSTTSFGGTPTFFNNSAARWSSSMWWETTFTMPRMEIATSRPHTPRATPEDQCDTYRHCIYFSIWPGIQVTMNMTTVHVATRISTTYSGQYPEGGEEYWRWLWGSYRLTVQKVGNRVWARLCPISAICWNASWLFSCPVVWPLCSPRVSRRS
jgi:hypothetical protein